MDREKFLIKKINRGEIYEQEDLAAIEESFTVMIKNGSCWNMNCTPENLEELTLGALFSRGYIENADQVLYLTIDRSEKKILVELSKKQSDSDGLITEVEHSGYPEKEEQEEIFRMAEEIFEKPGRLFQETGCAHCCAWVKNGKIVCSFEDIGRHNALDKVIGYALKEKISLSEGTLYTSGRISGDYLQKVIRAGVRTVVSRAAVTSQAIEEARKSGIRMMGFVRKNSGNIYSGL
ncbi:MAG: formate dehydrogenase accessory sulfurtransferase FdhD [Clostridia bacterium]|nr:formate dehydrogenase accessory sulfurtransferase FdhD [Clostridia bacterium]MDY5555216.1 formate dehydrogenase accessory sulfurtransferase FdhD [Blautia sp.]